MKKKYPTATVVITGHSLGGAIAYIYIYNIIY
jgi:putative lipase involved disintegration of autophagic bodies